MARTGFVGGVGPGAGETTRLHCPLDTGWSIVAWLCPARGRVSLLLAGVAGRRGHRAECTAACPHSSAVDALRAALLRGGGEDVVQRVELEGGWESLRTSAGHEDGVSQLAR